ncbi:hypothetical protein NMG60_11026001 [Bertholletia excelsa]
MAKTVMFSSLLFSGLVLLLLIANPTGAVTCSDAAQDLLPCLGYLTGGVPAPPDQCCTGAKTLNQIAAASAADRKVLCECFKSAVKSLPINLNKAKQIPVLCNFTPVLPIDPSVDCSQ